MSNPAHLFCHVGVLFLEKVTIILALLEKTMSASLQEAISQLQAKLEHVQSLLSGALNAQNEVLRQGINGLSKLIDDYTASLKSAHQTQKLAHLKQEPIPFDLDDASTSSATTSSKSASPELVKPPGIRNIPTVTHNCLSAQQAVLKLGSSPEENHSNHSYHLYGAHTVEKVMMEQSRSIQERSSETEVVVSTYLSKIKSEDDNVLIVEDCTTDNNNDSAIQKPERSDLSTSPKQEVIPLDLDDGDDADFNDLLGEFENANDLYGMLDDMVESELSNQNLDETDTIATQEEGRVRTVAEVAEEMNTTDLFDSRILGK